MKCFPIVIFLALTSSLVSSQRQNARSFSIDYERNTFVKDGKPFRYISGSIHPYRVPRELWQDRLDKMWAAGLNAIQVYTFWDIHEPYEGLWDFNGQNDIFHFLNLANSTGFVVVLRPGPYVCAEHDYGGLPWWLLSNGVDNIKPRTIDPNYFDRVISWAHFLLPKLEPYLYKNGGPVITVQVENEYGFYKACDKVYTRNLRDLFIDSLGNDTVYFTTDPPTETTLKCGSIDGVYATVDFGTDKDVDAAFAMQRSYAPKGPLVNSEYYPGWLDWWGSPHAKVPTERVMKSFVKMLDLGANVNFYMFIGGTNFGFLNGANQPYLVQPTSYDYDAPLSECGDTTDKYFAIRSVISEYTGRTPPPVPANSTKLALGRVPLTYHVSLVDAILDMSSQCIESIGPKTFEQVKQGYGFILYKVKLPFLNVHGKSLRIPKLHDRAFIQIGDVSVGVLYRAGSLNLKINLPNNTNDTMFIIVENMGRLNFGSDMLDTKGILDFVELDGHNLTDYTICITSNFIPNYQFDFENSDWNRKHPFGVNDLLSQYVLKRQSESLITKKRYRGVDFKAPAIYVGEFQGPNIAGDTFLKMDKFTKGVALIRSKNKLTNLGRYWPQVGPQVTLYTPGPFITQSDKNYVVLVEFEGSSCDSSSDCYVDFIDHPILDSIPSNTYH